MSMTNGAPILIPPPFIPHRFYRALEEGNYRRKELTDFNPLTKTAVMNYEEYNVKENAADEKRKRESKTVKIPQYVQDLVSGYYYLRTLDFNKLTPGQVITIPGILEEKLYELKIRYLGKDVAKTKFGKMNAHRLVPIMPENSLFAGESSVRFWVSDDKNRVPIRVEADMFIGKVVVEIKDYKNIRHNFNFQ
ncbi:MAG: DUF3108 domain-containing protein [Microscillaceae bacterium]|nr:DUF3108 domain-containing protein [Microscillaceae bacterium]